MKVAIIGGGGREHALTWKIAQSPQVSTIYAFTTNPGIAGLAEIVDIDPNDFKKLAAFLKKEKVDYTIVGPEDPLVNGIVDYLEKEGLKAFGPDKQGAMLEGSKIFAKEIMKKAGVPTGEYREFADPARALSYVKRKEEYPIVIKADGLCAGKGVAICQNFAEAEAFIVEVLEENVFGEAGSKILVEEFLDGEEVSIFAITDGKTVRYLSPAQDHKQVYEGDKGPNTGGMGTYASTTLVNQEILEEIHEMVTAPLLETLREEGIVYKGVLYAGLIMSQKGPKVLEFNCRFGDPETQVLMPLLESDLMDIVKGVCDETLKEVEVSLSSKKAVCFVAASGGYPGKYEKGKEIHGLNQIDSLLFHAGVKEENGKYLTNGGRVLNVVSVTDSIEKCREKALYDLEKLSFEGMHYRKDIAVKELKRPAIAFIMGSDSDLPVIQEGLKILEGMDLKFRVYTLSAHRTPEMVADIVKSWKYRGIKVVVAAAGMSAHLPGVVAAYTDLPVIGIPLEAKLQGLDALFSIFQMPGGVPVATVSMGKAGAKNAAILALEILGIHDYEIKKKLKDFKKKQKTAVLEKNKLLQEIGYQEYLERK
jgi:phosphoribosylamine--glycine ligase